MSLHISSSSNVVVCSHCTLQNSLVQVILYLRVLLYIFISFIFSCITCMKLIVVKMKINVLQACHNNNYWQGITSNCENKIYVIKTSSTQSQRR